MTKLSDILPKKIKQDVFSKDYKTYNDALDACHTALSQALKDGVICFVPKEKDIIEVIYEFRAPIEMSVPECAQALIQLLKKGTDSNI